MDEHFREPFYHDVIGLSVPDKTIFLGERFAYLLHRVSTSSPDYVTQKLVRHIWKDHSENY